MTPSIQDAQAFFESGDIDQADTACQAILTSSPNATNPMIHHLYSLILSYKGDTNQALHHIDQAISLLSDCAQLYNNKGNLMLRRHETKNAMDCYEQAITIDPNYAPAHNNLANCLFKLNKNTQAKTHYLTAIRLEPEFADAHFNYARLLLSEGSISSARYSLLYANQLNPQHPAVIGQLAEIALNEADYESAIGYLSDRLQLQPNHADSYHSLGVALFHIHEYKEATEALEQAIRLQTSAKEAHFDLANTKLEMGDFKSALTHYMRQIERLPLAEAYYNVGVIQMAQDHHQDALEYFQHALDMTPDHMDTLQNIAAIHLKMARTTKAISIYKKILTLNPENKEVSHILQALNGEGTPDSAPSEYIKNLFNHYANYYDKHLIEHLHYDVPAQLLQAIENEGLCGNTEAWRILDLGCGTGLIGEKVKHLATHLVGIDIAPQMIQQAEKKGVYHDLIMGDLTDAFRSQRDMDLIIAGDVFTYVGDLSSIFTGAQQALKDPGYFAFTIERTHGTNYQLQQTIRYAHSEDYIRSLAKQCGFAVTRLSNMTLRRQHGEPVEGYLVILTKHSEAEQPD